MADRIKPTKRQKSPVQKSSAMRSPLGGGAGSGAGAGARVATSKPTARAVSGGGSKPAGVRLASGVATPNPSAARPAASAPSLGSKAARNRVTSLSAKRPTSGRAAREQHQRAQAFVIVLRVLGGLAGLAVALVLAFFILRNSSVFAITNVVAEATDHVSESDLQNLVQVPEGATLLNVDTDAIEEALKQDPWVASVTFERQFPSTLKVVVHEQEISSLVVMGAGAVAWYLGDAGIWIQPTKLDTSDGTSANDAALAKAQAEGHLLITDVPATANPEAGSVATDDTILAVQAFQEGFSDEFKSQIVSYSAPDESAISCVLSNGVYVSLGAAENIAQKERVVEAYFEQYGEGSVLSINVRDPENAAVKTIDSADVQAGDGVTTGTTDGSAADATTDTTTDATTTDATTDATTTDAG